MSARSAPERRSHDRRVATDGRFWRALKGERRVADRRRGAEGEARPDPEAPASTSAPAPPSRPAPSAEDARRAALRGMLEAAEARQDRIGRTRRPVLAEGTRVRVVRGELAGLSGVILDADYIESRVLLRLDERERPCWVPFSRVGPP